MICLRVARANRELGKRKGYTPLSIRDEELVLCAEGGMVNAMVSAWEPTQEELARLLKGAPVYLRVLGTVHPPVQLEVGKEPDMTDG